MAQSDIPFLSLLIFLPLTAGIGLFAIANERLIRPYALSFALLELALSVALLLHFRTDSADMQFIEHHAWIPSLNIVYRVGVDGISVLFLPLTALLTSGVILSSWTSIHTLPRLYFALLLALESVTLGIFCALDLGLFFLFWELTLPPLYFLISLWGIGPQRRHAAIQYTLFMLAGGIPLLLGFILLALNHAREMELGLSFDYLNLLETPIPLEIQSLIFLLLLLGFAVKAPVFPFHVWLPSAAMEGPVGASALLMGLKLGLYGIIRFAIPLAPQAAHRYSMLLAGLGVAGALYGALIALRQTNLRRMLAFSGISHVGLVLIGIASLNIQGIQGAVFQSFNFGIVAGGIFLMTGFIQHRLGSTDLTAMGGLAHPVPLLTSFFFLLGLAAMGVPGSNGFAAEHLIVIGAFKARTGLGLATLLAAILGAAYFLGFFRIAFLGPSTRRAVREMADLRPREAWVAATMVLLTLAGGLFPQIWLGYSQKSLQAWIARLEADHFPTLAMAGKATPEDESTFTRSSRLKQNKLITPESSRIRSFSALGIR